MVHIGDRRAVYPDTFEVRSKGRLSTISGTVVYIHPALRYCVLEFNIGERVREAFQLIAGEVAEWHRKKPRPNGGKPTAR